MDTQAKNYQSVASSQYANSIYKNIGIRRIDDFHFFIPSRGQVMNALDIIGSLGYEFVDGEIRKKKLTDIKTNKKIKDYGRKNKEAECRE